MKVKRLSSKMNLWAIRFLSALVAVNGFNTRSVTSSDFSNHRKNSSIRRAPSNPSFSALRVPSGGSGLQSTRLLAPRAMTQSSSSDDTPTAESIFGFFGVSKPRGEIAVFFLIALSVGLTRLIPRTDVAFSIAFPLYLMCANRFRFNRNGEKERVPLLREGRGPWFKNYLMFFGSIGLLLPLMVCFVTPSTIADAAAPHLYLTACQVTMEALSNSSSFHALPRLLTPIGFNAFRLRTLWVWVKQAYATATSSGSSVPNQYVSAFAFSLAVVNLIAWTYNLFGFLLLRAAPQYLDTDSFPVADVKWKGALFPVLTNKKKD